MNPRDGGADPPPAPGRSIGSDERLQLVLASLGAGLVCADTMGVVTFRSVGLEALADCEPAGLAPGDLVPASGPAPRAEVVMQALHLRGGPAWLFVRSDGLSAESETLRRNNRILRDVIDALDSTVVAYDRDQRFVLSNPAFHKLFPHLPPERELVGVRFQDMLEMSMKAGAVHDPQATIDPAGFIARRVREQSEPDGGPREVYERQLDRWFLLRTNWTPEGNRVGLRIDITEQKRLLHELEAARAAAEDSNIAKSRFLTAISHELRTPLNAVINFARLIEEQLHGELNREYLSYAAQIQEAGWHLLRLINELLELGRAEAGRLELTEHEIDLAHEISAVCRLLGAEAASHGVSLEEALEPDLPHVWGDRTRLRQVLFNLLSNALKYTQSGGQVEISAIRDAAGGVTIAISDNGVGIAEKDLDRVMQPFERGVQPGGRSVPGTGLGLPLAQQILELHGGTLRLRSAPGVGTTATVTLPATRLRPSQGGS